MAGAATSTSDVIPGIPGIGDAGPRRPPAPPHADSLAGPRGGGFGGPAGAPPPPPPVPGFPLGWPPPPPPRGAMPHGRHPGGPQWRGGPPRGGPGRGPGFRPRAPGPGPGASRGRSGGGSRIMRPQQAGAPAQPGAGSSQRPGALLASLHQPNFFLKAQTCLSRTESQLALGCILRSLAGGCILVLESCTESSRGSFNLASCSAEQLESGNVS